MAISYTLVQRKDMSRGALEDAKLYYAQRAGWSLTICAMRSQKPVR